MAAVAIAQAPPHISNDFVAIAEIVESEHDHKVKFSGKIFESFSDKKSRIDAQFNHEDKFQMEILRLFDTHEEYRIKSVDHKSQNCSHKDLNHTMFPAFNWVRKGAKREKHECPHKRDNTPGHLWTKTNENFKAALCVNVQDSADPLWVEYVDENTFASRRIDFKSFTPGNPDAKVFVVPTVCDKAYGEEW